MNRRRLLASLAAAAALPLIEPAEAASRFTIQLDRTMLAPRSYKGVALTELAKRLLDDLAHERVRQDYFAALYEHDLAAAGLPTRAAFPVRARVDPALHKLLRPLIEQQAPIVARGEPMGQPYAILDGNNWMSVVEPNDWRLLEVVSDGDASPFLYEAPNELWRVGSTKDDVFESIRSRTPEGHDGTMVLGTPMSFPDHIRLFSG